MPSTITDRLNGLTTSVAVKAPCRVATTAAITLSGEQTIDGVAVVAGDRVLVKDQASAVGNGIYVAATSSWTRATDFDGTLDAVGGTQIHVISGTANANTYWRVDGIDTSVVIGTDSITFEPAGLSDSAAHTFLHSGSGAQSRSVQDKLREEASLWDVIPSEYRSAIEAGNSSQDVTSYINQALTNYRRVIVRRGVYCFSTPILFTASEQCLEFEEGAWFKALNTTTNGIACPHNILDCRLINPGVIGRAASETGQVGILWNSNAGGTAPNNSLTSDDMGGLIENARFKGVTPGTNGCNVFIHSNMGGGLIIRGVYGRDLYGTNSNYGYGVIVSGSDVTLRDIDVDPVITNQGRHGIYLGDQCAGADVSGFRIRNFQKSGFSVNTGTTDGNSNIRITNGHLENVCMAVDASGTNSAMDFTYQGAATHGGIGLHISDINVDYAGILGLFLSGYDRATIANVTVADWGKVGAGGVAVALHALKVLNSDYVSVSNFQSFTDAANSGSTTIQHVAVQTSSNFSITGGGAYNTGSGAQNSGLTLNATAPGTANCVIDRFNVEKGSGSWSVGAYVNPTQNGSVVVYPKAGRIKTDTQTGADVVLDVSGGETAVILDAGCDSVLNMTAAGAGQVVTLVLPDTITVKNTNFYLAGAANFSGTANDTITLVYNGGAWVETARSVN